MATKRYEDMTPGELILAGAAEAVEIEHGRAEAPRRVRIATARHAAAQPPPAFDAAHIKRIRLYLGFSQTVFAQVLCVSAPTVRSWEQGQREPDGASRRLLQIAESRPEALLQVSGAATRRRAQAQARPVKRKGGTAAD